MPLAITTSVLSDRIKTQKGHFVAMDIQADKRYPEIDELDSFHEYFFKNIYKSSYKPFMAKIIIPNELKQTMAYYVKHMGISLSGIYPELENIGKDVNLESRINQKFMK